MTRLVLIRHGETDWNVDGRYQGQADPPLNSRGLEQARQLSRDLESIGLHLLYTSPLLRAMQTARLLAKHLNLPLNVESRLMEIHQGDWQARLRADIQHLYPDLFRLWENEPWAVTPPGGEHLSHVQIRVDTALDEILAGHPNHCVGLVTHRIPIALIKIRYQGLDAAIVRTLELPNTYWEEIDILIQQR